MHLAQLTHIRTNVKHTHRNYVIEAKFFHRNQFLILRLILSLPLQCFQVSVFCIFHIFSCCALRVKSLYLHIRRRKLL